MSESKGTPAVQSALVVGKQTTPKVKIKSLSKTKAAELVLEKGKRFFNVTFMKKNPSKAKGAPALIERNMTCRLSVVKHTKAAKEATAAGLPIPKLASNLNKNLAVLGKVTVYEMTGDKGYKTLSLDTITALKIAGEQYKVK